MAATDKVALTGTEKAAVLLISLGEDHAASVLKQMKGDEVERVVSEIGRQGEVKPATKEHVGRDFLARLESVTKRTEGGWDYARNTLERAVGQEPAGRILKLAGKPRQEGFALLEAAPNDKLTKFLLDEHPQTIALILTQLAAEKAALALAGLPEALRPEVTARIAAMDKVPAEMLSELKAVIVRDLGQSLAPEEDAAQVSGGPEKAAAILNKVDKEIGQKTLESLADVDPELVDEIKKKMFVFDDIRLIDDKGVQRFLKEIESKVLGVALKACASEIKENIFRNMSKRAGELLKEEMELMGPIRLSQVEEAQESIVEVVRRLVEEGEINLMGRGGQEDELVG